MRVGNPRRWLQYIPVAALIAGCSQDGERGSGAGQVWGVKSAEAATRYRTVKIDNVPHVKQKPDFCGEACAEMALRRLGHAVSQDQVFAATGVDPAHGRGAYTRGLARGLKRLGFEVGKVWFQIDASRSARELERQFQAVHDDLHAGTPSILCMRYDHRPDTTEHFRLIVGYDRRTDEVLFHEPAVSGGAYKRMKRRRLLQLWPLKYRQRSWTVIRIPLKPGKIRPPARRRGYSRADFAQHVKRLKEKHRSRLEGFTIVIQPPFVVIGDEAPSVVHRRAVTTVKWSVDRLKEAYFHRDPKHILDIWLLKDRASYLRFNLSAFGQRPGTPYGFYSQTNRALVMNIATGGGTLVHEIVHPFMEANFPGCPPWFNEGLGSMYEQSADRGGKIWGLTNWRLPGLQRAIRAGKVPSFKHLMSRNTRQFYNLDPGTNYSQSRYLLYYLQGKGLLRTYYRRFLARRAVDPTGHDTFQRLLGRRDMAAFKREWEAHVLTLRFR